MRPRYEQTGEQTTTHIIETVCIEDHLTSAQIFRKEPESIVFTVDHARQHAYDHNRQRSEGCCCFCAAFGLVSTECSAIQTLYSHEVRSRTLIQLFKPPNQASTRAHEAHSQRRSAYDVLAISPGHYTSQHALHHTLSPAPYCLQPLAALSPLQPNVDSISY